jgi:hypothetical protein
MEVDAEFDPGELPAPAPALAPALAKNQPQPRLDHLILTIMFNLNLEQVRLQQIQMTASH